MIIEPLRTGDAGSLSAALAGILTKAELLTYMGGCPVVLSARTLLPDQFDPNARRIPLTWYCDGAFAWSAESIAYIDRYDASVPSYFIAHVARCGAQPPTLDPYTHKEAVTAINGPTPQVVPSTLWAMAHSDVDQAAKLEAMNIVLDEHTGTRRDVPFRGGLIAAGGVPGSTPASFALSLAGASALDTDEDALHEIPAAEAVATAAWLLADPGLVDASPWPFELAATKHLMAAVAEMLGPGATWFSNAYFEEVHDELNRHNSLRSWNPVTGHYIDVCVVGCGADIWFGVLAAHD